MPYLLETDPSDHSKLRRHEEIAFHKIAAFYQTNLKVIRTEIGKTPDIHIPKIGTWEVKSPQGNSKNTIENSFKQAKSQSSNVLIDLSRIKLRSDVAIRQIITYSKKSHKHIKHIKVLTKTGQIIDIS